MGIEGKESTEEDGEDHWKEMDPLETGTVKPKEGKKRKKKKTAAGEI